MSQRVPPFLPTVPLPVGMVGSGMMYMYSCSQCDFKTHIEAMFKQHVDSVHLGLAGCVTSNMVLGNNMLASSTSGAVALNPVAVSASMSGQPGASALMMATAAHGSGLGNVHKNHPAIAHGGGLSTVHKCTKCGFLAPSKNQLTQHKRKFHGKQTQYVPQGHHQPGSVVLNASQATATGTNATGKKTYTCSTCGYSTTRRDGLSQHYDSVHLKIKNHQCALCPYAASQKGTLNRHVKLRHKKKDDGGVPGH